MARPRGWGLAIFWLALLLCSGPMQASPIDVGAFKTWPVDITQSVSLYEDRSGTMELSDIAALSDHATNGFQPANYEKLHPGPSKSAWWLQVHLANHSSQASALYLVPSLYVPDRIDFHLQQSGRWEHHQAGLQVAQSQQTYPTRHPLLPVTLEPGENVRILIRAQSEYPLQLRPQLYSEAAYSRYDDNVKYWDGLLYGGLLALGWGSLVIALLSRNVAFFLLSAVSLMVALTEIDRRGYGKFLLWPESVEWSYRSLSVMGQFSLFLFLAFVLEVARQERLHLPLRRWLIGLMVVEGMLSLTALFGGVYLVAAIAKYTLPIHSLLLLIAAIGLMKSNAPTRKLMLLVGAHGVIRLVMAILERQGMLPDFFLQLGPLKVNPVLSLLHFYINLAALAAWINHVGKQRKEATHKLMEWQKSENERLNEEVARQTEALKRAVHYADDKNRQKTELLGYISHDLRAPLATIVGYAKLLKATPENNQSEHIEAIVRSANYQMALIDELLHYTRSELKPLALAATPTKTAMLLDDITQQALSLCTLQNNRFECRAMAPLPETLLIDGKRLQQVLLNLLSNASKFTSNGTVSLHITADRIDNAWRLHFDVADTGIGVDPERQTLIFKAFEQAQIQPEGVGLGLYIAKSIIEGMEGKLSLESEPGKGSTFSFQILAKSLNEKSITWTAPIPATSDAKVADIVDAYAVSAISLPVSECMELAMLARDGRLTEIESWLTKASIDYPQCAAYIYQVRSALHRLDFPYIESWAMAQAQEVYDNPISMRQSLQR